MPDTRSCTYEDLYYEMWEISQRYSQITQFRVIGKSHDERMIPMVELGKGNTCIFCISGLTGLDRQTPGFLIQMLLEYVKAWENGWKIEEIYDIREFLEKWRICFIPVLNPDGYAIFRRSAIRFIARCFECRKFRQKSIQEMQEGRISGKIFLRSIIRGSRSCSSRQAKMRPKR